MVKEKKIWILILVLYTSNLAFSILYPTFKSYLYSKDTAPISVPSINLNIDGSSSSSTELVPPEPAPFFLKELLTDFTLSYFLMVFPAQLLGFWLLTPIVWLGSGSAFLHLLLQPPILIANILWLGAVVFVFLLLKYSKGIPVWRRLLYCYLIATQIAAFGAINWAPIGS